MSTMPNMSEPIEQRLLPEDSAARKTYPMAAGLLDYFPDALAAVANVSFVGNQKHNPGEDTHWARGKSMDHADCIVRHLAARGTKDRDGIRHSANLAWRALALLQEEIERELGLTISRGSRFPVAPAYNTQMDALEVVVERKAGPWTGTGPRRNAR